MDHSGRLLGRTDGPWHGTSVPGGAMEIVEVYSGSIAEAAGLKAGMLYLLDPQDASAQEWSEVRARGATGTLVSRFIDRDTRSMLTIESAGFPWGMQLKLPSQKLVDEVLSSYVNPTRLAGPLLNGTDAAFRDLTNAALTGAMRTSMKQRFVKTTLSVLGRGGELRPVIQFQNAVAAIAAARNGDAQLARRLMPELDDRLLHHYGTGAGAVCLYAKAMVAESEGRPHADIAGWLGAAFQLSPTSKRIADALTSHGEPTVAKGSHTIARPFGVDYQLPAADALNGALRQEDLESLPQVTLSQSLAELRPDQLGIVIMLGGYRVNGPYSSLMENLGHLYGLMGAQLPFVHVISALGEVTEPEIVAMWREGEDLARSAGCRSRCFTTATILSALRSGS